MAKEILHIDVGGTVTTARGWSETPEGLRPIVSHTSPSGASAGGTDLAGGALPAYEGAMEKAAREGRKLNPELVVATNSAGGEPRVACAGVIKGISGASAVRAALAAGATVVDVLAVDDGRLDHQRVSDLRRQPVSMVLMAGGVDEEIMDSGRHQLFNIAKLVADGLPNSPAGDKASLVYAASQEGRQETERLFGPLTQIVWADNVRARLEEEHLDSARNAVVGLFSDSAKKDPRFRGLGRLGSPSVIPSGHALGLFVEGAAEVLDENVMAVSLDGDSVQILSVIGGVFTRTVTGLGRVDAQNVLRWLPSEAMISGSEDSLANWKSRPGTLPTTWDELALYLAIQKETVVQAMADHREYAVELRGIHRQRLIGETFEVSVSGGDTLVRMERVPHLCVTGYLAEILSDGALLSIVLDAVEPLGVTRLYLDKEGLMSVSGALGYQPANLSVLSGLTPLGVLLAPGLGHDRMDSKWAYMGAGSSVIPLPCERDSISVVEIPLGAEQYFEVHASGKVDVGDGPGRKYRTKVAGFGNAFVDCRPRTRRQDDRYRRNARWYRTLGVFPSESVDQWERGRS